MTKTPDGKIHIHGIGDPVALVSSYMKSQPDKLSAGQPIDALQLASLFREKRDRGRVSKSHRKAK